MGAFEDFVNQNLGIRRPIITDAGHPSQSLKAAGIVGTNYLDSNDNQLYEKTGEDNINDWMPVGKVGHSRFSGESGIYWTMTGYSGFFNNQAIVGTAEEVTLIVTEQGRVGINTEFPSYDLHVSGNAKISGGNLILDYDQMPANNPNTRGAVWRSGDILRISAG